MACGGVEDKRCRRERLASSSAPRQSFPTASTARGARLTPGPLGFLVLEAPPSLAPLARGCIGHFTHGRCREMQGSVRGNPAARVGKLAVHRAGCHPPQSQGLWQKWAIVRTVASVFPAGSLGCRHTRHRHPPRPRPSPSQSEGLPGSWMDVFRGGHASLEGGTCFKAEERDFAMQLKALQFALAKESHKNKVRAWKSGRRAVVRRGRRTQPKASPGGAVARLRTRRSQHQHCLTRCPLAVQFTEWNKTDTWPA